MKPLRYMLFVLFILTILIMGCSAVGNDNGENLQRLSKIDIYSGNGDLLNSITDESSLRQFSDVMGYYAMPNEETEQNDFAKSAETLPVMYNIVFYKTPASRFNDGDLEEELRITMYEDSDIVKEIISPENVKSISVPEEYLTFYFSMSDEDRVLFISKAEETD